MFVCRGWKEVIAVRTALLPSRASEKHTLWFYFLYSMEYRWLLWSLYILLRLGPSADHQIIWNHKEMEFTGIERSQSELSAMNLRRKKKEQNIQVTKMFIVAVIVFSLSMFPNQVLWLWVDFGNGKDSDYFAIISAICWLFTYSNSVLNAIMYGFYSREFRFRKSLLKNSTCPMSTQRHAIMLTFIADPSVARRDGHEVESTNSVFNEGGASRWYLDIANNDTFDFKESSRGEGIRISFKASIQLAHYLSNVVVNKTH